ncbi:MAG: opacity protein-like surface antigen [Paraglaciecola sp.]|jgi:opacity protein-like surface antigen
MTTLFRYFFCTFLLCITTATAAQGAPVQVQIAEPFIELHTGPADGYPVFHVAAKGEWISVLKRRTSWFKVETETGQQGWVTQQALHLTLNSEGQAVSLFDGSFASFAERDVEFGAMGGSFENVPSLTVFASWVMTENILADLSVTQALGDFSENQFVLASVMHHPFPEWRISPYFILGLGQIRTKPRANLVEAGSEARTSDLFAAGLGVRYYLAQNFIVKLEYKSLLVLTDRDENEELEEWKLGFAVFF